MAEGTTTEELFANIIAENVLAQVDTDRHKYEVIKEKVDHKNYWSAVAKEDGFITTKSNRQVRKHTTSGRKLIVKWKSGTTD